jgi:hypothetical protein
MSPFGVVSQTSPTPSLSVSVCDALETETQLSAALSTPSLSVSPFGVMSALLPMPSPSASTDSVASSGNASLVSATLSLSSSLSQTSPSLSPSVLN